MKIGIITYWNTEFNYGQILQCYALQQFLKKKGHEAFLIRYNPVYRISGFLSLLQLPLKILKAVEFRIFKRKTYLREKRRIAHMDAQNKKNPRYFSRFKEQYLSSSPLYNQDELLHNPPQADAYITGSDQVWAMCDPNYFLEFAPAGKLRIAYAPSFGGVKYEGAKRQILAGWLRKFNHITVREKEGLDVCTDLGFPETFIAPDPTLLLQAKDYLELTDNQTKQPEEEFVFMYMLNHETDFDLSGVYAWSKKMNLPIKYVAGQDRADDYAKTHPTIQEWLQYIHKARYVITNSFHGMVFCIIFNKQFVAVPLSGEASKMNSRVFDLLAKFGLQERLYNQTLDVLSNPIDYTKINSHIENEIQVISQWFDEILKTESL